MALNKIVEVDLIEVLADGHLQVRTVTKIMENNIMISQNFHRHVVSPGDDCSQQDGRVKAIASAIWTDDVIAKHKNKNLTNSL